ncbi:macro domain-containing protein [Microbacterium oleivorans]|uniref:macro domain-containing protein n=1 Tax=Microbacterium oleivorans TaxID=273677 RepID=UPI00080E717A|nr:macro domain-containing protein [Microbacterium oleivorans]
MQSALTVSEVDRDITSIPVDAIVNPWNRNVVPRWLLVPGGVSGALKRKTGPGPWKELARHGILELGQAVTTSAGDLPTAKALIHVAGLTLRWTATTESVRLSTVNAVAEARAHGFASLAIPLIGAGHGGMSSEASRTTILNALDPTAPLHVLLVEHTA